MEPDDESDFKNECLTEKDNMTFGGATSAKPQWERVGTLKVLRMV